MKINQSIKKLLLQDPHMWEAYSTNPSPIKEKAKGPIISKPRVYSYISYD